MSTQNLNPQHYQKVISIDSSSRSSGDSSSFSLRLPIPQRNEFDKVALLIADIPKGYYMFNSADAAASNIVFTDGGVGTPVTAFPTDARNYSASQMAATLKTMLDASAVATTTNETYTVTFQSFNGKFRIVNDSANAFTVDFIGPLFAKYSGFIEGAVNASSGGVGVLVSSKRVNLQKYDSVFIHSSLVSNNGDDRLAELYMNDVSNLDLLSFKTPDANLYSRALSNGQTNEGTFSLQDKNGAAIDLNGGEWRATIVLYSFQNKNQ